MNLHQIKTFHLVTSAGSYIKAARTRNVDRTSIKMSIKNLHESIGCRLFVLNTFNAELTSEGKWLLPRAVAIVDELNKMEEYFKNPPKFNKMTFHQLKMFHLVVKTGSYSKAARTRNVVTGSIITSIIKLQQDLGCRLFLYNTFKAELTPEGKWLRTSAEIISDEVKTIEEYFEEIKKNKSKKPQAA